MTSLSWRPMPKENPEVSRVMRLLEDDSYLDGVLEVSRKTVFGLMANVHGMQLNPRGPIIFGACEAIRSGELDAVLVTTAMSGNVPTRSTCNGALLVAAQCMAFDVPCFAVRYASYPQVDRDVLLEDYGCVHLKNAFSGELDRVVRVIHGALNASESVDVVKSAVFRYYEQTQYPPRGWEVRPASVQRVSEPYPLLPDSRSAAGMLRDSLEAAQRALYPHIMSGDIDATVLGYIVSGVSARFNYRQLRGGRLDGSGDMYVNQADLFRSFSVYESRFPRIRAVFATFLDELRKEPRIHIR